MRYFIGIIPPSPLLERIVAFQKQWPSNKLPEHIPAHITVKSPVGLANDEAWIARAEEIIRSHADFQVRLSEPGFFGDSVVFLRVDVSKELAKLHDELVNALAPQELEKESYKDFKPHLTLAMATRGMNKEDLPEIARRAAAEFADMPSFPAGEIVICRQENQDDPYEIYKTFKLKQ